MVRISMGKRLVQLYVRWAVRLCKCLHLQLTATCFMHVQLVRFTRSFTFT